MNNQEMRQFKEWYTNSFPTDDMYWLDTEWKKYDFPRSSLFYLGYDNSCEKQENHFYKTTA